MSPNVKITTLQDLQSYSRGQVVELPPFAENQPFVARLGRPSILELVKSGAIPNALLTTANKLFTSTSMDVKQESLLSDVFQVMDTLCEATFLEPTYKEIKEAGISLTDEQMMFVFNYSQRGVEALKTFRLQSQNLSPVGGSSEV